MFSSRPPFWRVPRNRDDDFDGEPVVAGSPAEGELHRGDVLTKINGKPCREMTHKEAAEMIKNAGTTIELDFHRGGPLVAPPAQPRPATTTVAPLVGVASPGPNRKVSTQSGQQQGKTISQIMQSPVENLPVTIFPNAQINELFNQQLEEMDRNRERLIVTHQPYRTTPLVLPGAKMGRDTTPITQSFLAMQSQGNSMLWNAPPVTQQQPNRPLSSAGHLPNNEVLLKQKDIKVFDPTKGWRMDEEAHQQELEAAAAMVQTKLNAVNEPAGQMAISHEAGEALPCPPAKQQQELVHKQFNSPLGLYSNESVQEVLQQQSGVMPAAHPARHLDLKHSEALRALREEEEARNKSRGDIRGLKEVRPPAPVKIVASNPHYKVNVMGGEKEKIAQSHSFMRLMADVLGETEF